MKSILTTLLIVGCLSLSAQDQLSDEIINTWIKHTEMNHLILGHIPEGNLKDLNDSSSRNVGDQFAHMHNVRMMWLGKMKEAEGLDNEIDAEESQNKDYVLSTLKTSDKLVQKVLKDALENNTKIGNLSPVRFMGYLISHESHTRGQIVLALKNSGHALPPNVGYGIWSW